MRVYPKFNHIINDAILLLYSKAVYKKQYLAIHKYLEMIVEGIRLVSGWRWRWWWYQVGGGGGGGEGGGGRLK